MRVKKEDQTLPQTLKKKETRQTIKIVNSHQPHWTYTQRDKKRQKRFAFIVLRGQQFKTRVLSPAKLSKV
jgi:hypothetical protein